MVRIDEPVRLIGSEDRRNDENDRSAITDERSPMAASSGGAGLCRQFDGNCFEEIEARGTLSGTLAVTCA